MTLPATLTAGQSVSFSVSVLANLNWQCATGSLAITSNATNSALDGSLSGTGLTPGQLTAAAASLSFGSVATGSNTSLTETLTNSEEPPASQSLPRPRAATGFAFTVSGFTSPATLTAGQSVSFSVKAPANLKRERTPRSLAVTSERQQFRVNIPLSGTGLTPGSAHCSPGDQ